MLCIRRKDARNMSFRSSERGNRERRKMGRNLNLSEICNFPVPIADQMAIGSRTSEWTLRMVASFLRDGVEKIITKEKDNGSPYRNLFSSLTNFFGFDSENLYSRYLSSMANWKRGRLTEKSW